MAWVAASVLLGLMATGVTPFEGPWKWATFALVVSMLGAKESRRIWVIRWW
jgi:hypothetical protein